MRGAPFYRRCNSGKQPACEAVLHGLLLEKTIELGLEQRTILADCRRYRAAIIDDDVGANLDGLENLGPDLRNMTVNDREGQYPGVDHFENIFVLQVLVGGGQLDRFELL